MYRAWLTFDKDYVNPFTGRVGRWRVLMCQIIPSWYRTVAYGPDFLAIHVSKVFRKGTIVNPTKELKKVLEARRGSA